MPVLSHQPSHSYAGGGGRAWWRRRRWRRRREGGGRGRGRRGTVAIHSPSPLRRACLLCFQLCVPCLQAGGLAFSSIILLHFWEPPSPWRLCLLLPACKITYNIACMAGPFYAVAAAGWRRSVSPPWTTRAQQLYARDTLSVCLSCAPLLLCLGCL